ncbi:MAG: PUR family DNA/RNA-binding protein [Flavobacteriaceae bacterium]
MSEDRGYVEQEEIFSQTMRAGRRTYFFDVRETKAGDYYLTVTESKKFSNDDGSFHFKKHKIYLYKEDFAEFNASLNRATDFILKEKGDEVISERHQKDYVKPTSDEVAPDSIDDANPDNFTDISFDDI